MSTAIRKVELADPLPDVRVPDGYDAVMVVVTYRGVPIGDFRAIPRERRVTSGRLRDEIAWRFGDRMTRLWLDERMVGRRSDSFQSVRPSIDVVVCTCGRPDDLRRCLQSLSALSYPHKSVIVVDNGSDSETTQAVAREHGARYVREKNRGLDFARNAGIRVSGSEFVAFADDDVVVEPGWVESIVQAFQEDLAIACVTGLTLPLELETEAQELFETYGDGGMGRGYDKRVCDRSNLSPLATGKVGAGANMAFRSSVLKRIGGFDEALDCGTPAKAGGDADMFYRLMSAGYKICYEPRALAWHRHRRSMDELRGQIVGYSTAVYAFLTKCLIEQHDPDALTAGCSWFLHHHVKNLVRSLLRRGSRLDSYALAEIKGALLGPRAYMRAKSYVSRLRLEQGMEWRGRPDGGDALAPEGSLLPVAGSILSRLGGKRRRRLDD